MSFNNTNEEIPEINKCVLMVDLEKGKLDLTWRVLFRRRVLDRSKASLRGTLVSYHLGKDNKFRRVNHVALWERQVSDRFLP